MDYMKLLFLTSEIVPYSKTGGLADVSGALPEAISDLGHEVVVITPLYKNIDRERHGLQIEIPSLGVSMGWFMHSCAVWTAPVKENLSIYFIEHERFFGRDGLYDDGLHPYLDNLERFTFFSRAALEVSKVLPFKPDIIHVNDWQTAIVPILLKEAEGKHPVLSKAATVLTIHNLGYQGDFKSSDFPLTGLDWASFYRGGFEYYGRTNLLKAGIYNADRITTVSPSYANEIKTHEGGFGLDGVLRDRAHALKGILNGVDYSEWSPENDPYIASKYTVHDMKGKADCKLALQERLGLEKNPDIPFLGVISRLVYQKGMDILSQIVFKLLEEHLQIVVLGSGDSYLEHVFGTVPKYYPKKFSSYVSFNNELAHQIEAGCDFFLMPSRYEPCGLNQMYSLKYGTLPIVRNTGGLADTVENLNTASGTGTGFKFNDLTPDALYNTIKWALGIWWDRPDLIHKMRLNAMKQDYSWSKNAREYMNLYKEIMKK